MSGHAVVPVSDLRRLELAVEKISEETGSTTDDIFAWLDREIE